MYQFVHVESYSRTAPKSAAGTGKAGRSVKWIVDEARRDPGAIPHVEQPQAPTYLYGEPLEALEATCESWASSMTDGKGRKLRKDALCLAAGVVSAPHDIKPEAWASFKADTLKWLQGKYGESLRTVIEHTDESHPHLHFYCVPQPGQRFETVHQGKAAAAEAKANGALKGVQNQRYKAAMREYQDEFYDAVGIAHGFTRIGPAKRRLTREEWKLEQIQAAAAKAAIDRAEAMTAGAKAESGLIIEQAKAQANGVAREALKRADQIEQEAEKRGWQKAMDAFEALPWFKRIKAVVGRAVDERDQLKEQVQTVTEKLENERSARRTLADKAKGWYDAGKAAVTRVKQLEPALRKALEEAEDGRAARKQADDMFNDLKDARDLAKHWQATAEAHMPKQQPVMHVPGKKPKLTEGIEVGLGD